MNNHNYPKIHYPEVYVLEGGYSIWHAGPLFPTGMLELLQILEATTEEMVPRPRANAYSQQRGLEAARVVEKCLWYVTLC